MNFFPEYALLFAVAIPLAVLIGINIGLWFGGERDTLLLPRMNSFPTGEVRTEASPEQVVEMGPKPVVAHAANDEGEVAA